MENFSILRKYYYTLFLMLSLFISASSYDNKVCHRIFNDSIVNRFMSKVALEPLAAGSKFGQYLFVLDAGSFEGPDITTDGYLTVAEVTSKKSPRKWIVDGGYSADEPEMPSGLRHFYDPLGIDGGKKWLTDISGDLEAAIQKNITGNPQIDAKNWTFSYAENLYNWKIGKSSVVKCLETADQSQKDKFMAVAYRSLGEVLHLICDMTLPPHVRNDSHPVSGYNAIDFFFGDPDPCEALFKSSYIVENVSKRVEPSLALSFSKATKADAIFEQVATFTNKNFFSSGTICGDGIKTYTQLITGRPEYVSPKLQNLDYHAEDFYYYKTFETGYQVKLCRDLHFIKRRGTPYIDGECVQSMATVWVPTAIEAGYYAMRCFFPKLTISIDNYDQVTRKVTGSVTHTPDDEYSTMISYNGPVELITEAGNLITQLTCTNGSFTTTLSSSVPSVGAQFFFGNIRVRSNFIKSIESTFTLTTKPEKIYINKPCSLTVTGASIPKSCMVSWDFGDMGVTSDGPTQSWWFTTPGEKKIIADVYYKSPYTFWKSDTFTIMVHDTIIIDSITPDSALPLGYTVIKGKYFGDSSSTSSVYFDTVKAKITHWVNEGIYLYVPWTAKSGNVYVKARGLVSNPIKFNLIPRPKISSVEPSTFSVGSIITIKGSGFAEKVYGSTVSLSAGSLFTDAYSKILSWTDSAISLRVPNTATTGLIFVKTKQSISDSSSIKVIPDKNYLTSLQINVSVGNCSYKNHLGTTTTDTKYLSFKGFSSSPSITTFEATFDTSYTYSTVLYDEHHRIFVQFDSSNIRIKKLELYRSSKTDYGDNYSQTFDTAIISDLPGKLTPLTTNDSLTGYVWSGPSDSLIFKIEKLGALTRVRTVQGETQDRTLVSFPKIYGTYMSFSFTSKKR